MTGTVETSRSSSTRGLVRTTYARIVRFSERSADTGVVIVEMLIASS